MSRASTRTVVTGVCLALAFGYWWPAFAVPSATGFGDWQMVHHNWEAARVAVERYGEWPLFDPYHCGGVTILGNPESQSFSPLFLLSFVLGTTLATKVFLALHTAVALAGMFAYARRVLGASRPAAMLGAVVFAGSGFFAWHGAGGHATFASFAFLPALHLLLRQAETRAGALVLAAALLALTVAEGGTYPYPYMLVSLGLAALVRLVESPRDGARASRALVGIVLLSLGLAAFRLVPILATLTRLPRTIGGWDRTELLELVTMLTARDHAWQVPGHEFVWPEYATYVGVPALALAAIGLGRSVVTKSLRANGLAHLAMAAVIALLVAGNAGDFHPWPLLRAFPVFDSLRVPSRFLVVLTFHLAALGALGLDVVARRGSERVRRATTVAAWVVVVCVATDVVVVTRPIVNRWDRPPIDRSFVARERFYVRGDYDATYASLPARNESTTACYVGGMNWSVSPALRVGPSPFATTSEPRASIRMLGETSSSHRFHVASPVPFRLVTNQDFDPAFRSDVGEVVEDAGRLAVDLPAGERELAVSYGAETGLRGLGLSVATGVLIVLALLASRRLPRRSETEAVATSSPRRDLALRGLVVATIATAYTGFAFARRPDVRVDASGTFGESPEFSGANVVDGRPETEWIPPDGPTASIELGFASTKRVSSVTLVNGHNRHYRDRGVGDFVVELRRGRTLVESLPGSFPDITAPGGRIVLRPSSPDAEVDSIRVVVRRSLGLGAALAEVVVNGR